MAEEHARQFRGVWVPPTLFDMIRDKKISASDMVLLVVIDSLTQEGVGCWASNAYLAQQVGVTPRRVQGRLKELREMGLIKQKIGKNNRQRFIRVSWGKPPVRVRRFFRGPTK